MGRELPILFNTEMVTAILDGRKTVTRRLVKPQPEKNMKYKLGYCATSTNTKDVGKFGFGTSEWGGRVRCVRPPAAVGDILYVRETWGEWTDGYVYRAWTGPYPQAGCYPGYTVWRPSIHMPKEAARIWLKVTDVEANHLHDMTLDDFLNEGIEIPYEAYNDPDNAYMQAKSLFTDVWNSTINKKEQDTYSFDADPWVWVIKFERTEKPERMEE